LTAVASDRRALRWRLSGRVQGVYYRASTVQCARRLGLIGWAKNLPDGRVEVVAAGETAALTALTTWLWGGPPAARVRGVEIRLWGGGVPEEFVQR
jgi:acylphosphatase